MRVVSEMRVTVSHSGKQHSYQHALSLQRLGVLHQFVTSSYYRRSRWPDCVARQVPLLDAGLQKRWLNGLDEQRVSRRIGLELPELWYRNILKNGGRAELAMFQRDTRFDRWVSRRWACESDVFWGFQGSCLESLRAARKTGKLAVCEFATAHVTTAMRILGEEAAKHPEWAGTISNFHFPDWYRERLQQEPFEADFCVAASSFSQQSLIEAGIDSARIRILPLGADLSQFPFAARERKGPLKVLFVGGIGQRKGIKYLLEAIKNLNSTQIQLQLLGPLPADTSPLEEWSPWFDYLGRTNQTGVAKHMQEADVLVLPSVFEGFGLVILEAMATGLPVIANTHSCAPEVIRDGCDGFVLEPDDVNGLTETLEWCASHRPELQEMGKMAFERAQEFAWSKHRDRLHELLVSLEVASQDTQ